MLQPVFNGAEDRVANILLYRILQFILNYMHIRWDEYKRLRYTPKINLAEGTLCGSEGFTSFASITRNARNYNKCKVFFVQFLKVHCKGHQLDNKMSNNELEDINEAGKLIGYVL